MEETTLSGKELVLDLAKRINATVQPSERKPIWNEDRLLEEYTQLEKELKDYKWEDRYEWINIKKNKANMEYKNRRLESALKCYITGLLAIQYDASPEHTEKVNTKLRLDLLNNTIATLLEMEYFTQAIVVANRALALYPENAKILMRRGKCYLKLKQHDKAMYLRGNTNSNNYSADLTKAKEMAKGEDKLMGSIEGLLKGVIGGEASAPLGELYKNKSQYLGSERNEEEEEKAMLATLSNIQWLIYPFKKMFMTWINYFIGKKAKSKEQ